MKFIRYFLLACLLYAVAFQNAAAQPDSSYLKQGKFTKQLSDTLYIYFKVGKTDIIPSLMNNGTALQTFDRFLTDYTNPRFTFSLKGITLQGSASPEGKEHWNKILANRRADAIIKYIKNNHSVNEQLVQKGNAILNKNAHLSKWQFLRNTQVIIDYARVSKEEPMPQLREEWKPKDAQITTCAPRVFPDITAIKAIEIPNKVKGQEHKQKVRNFRIAVKTNALYDLLLTPNIGVEIPILKNWSIAGNWMYAWWKADPDSWYHRIYGGDIEIRRWLYTTAPLTGWHIGAYGQMLTYDFEWGGDGVLGDKWSYAAGLAVGYSKNLAPKLNIDFTLGVGYLTGEYKEYKPIDNCYVWQATKHRHWVGPTKAEVSLVWLLGKW